VPTWSSSANHSITLLLRASGELHGSGALADAIGLRLALRVASSTRRPGHRPVAVPTSASNRVGRRSTARAVGEPHLGEPGLLLAELRDAPPNAWERLRTGQIANRGIVGDPAAQELVLVLEPGCRPPR
jgi:hypothetical protein